MRTSPVYAVQARSARLWSGPTALAAIQVELLLALQPLLGQSPLRILVKRGSAERQPFHRPHSSQERGEIAAVAAADDRDRVGIHVVLRGEEIKRGKNVAPALLARDRFVLPFRLRVSAQVECQADAPACGDLAGTVEVLALVATPAVHEEHARDQRPRGDQRAEDVLALDSEIDGLIARGHHIRPARTW